MEEYFARLLGNSVFLMCTLPLLGAVTALASGRFGLDAVRKTALTNALVTLGLAVCVVVFFQPEAGPEADAAESPKAENETQATKGPPPYQMVTVIRWLAGERFVRYRYRNKQGEVTDVVRRETTGPDVRLAVGVDGLSVWPAALAALLATVAVLAGCESDHYRPECFYALILVAEAALIGVFVALDAILFCICVGVACAALCGLIGRWGGDDRRRIARSTAVRSTAAVALLTVAATGVASSHGWLQAVERGNQPRVSFSTPQWIDGVELSRRERDLAGIPSLTASGSAGELYWRGVGGLWFVLLAGGFFLLAGLFPFHGGFIEAIRTAPLAAAPYAVLLPVLAGYGVVRFLLPLFPEICIAAGETVSTFAVCSAMYCGWRALAAVTLRELTACGLCCHSAVAIACLFSLNRTAVAGGVLALCGAALAAALLLAAAGLVERRGDFIWTSPFDVGEFAKNSHACSYPSKFLANSPTSESVKFWIAAGLIGLGVVPGTALFAGQFAALSGMFRGTPVTGSGVTHTAFALVASLLTTWACMNQFVRFNRVLEIESREPETRRNDDSAPSQIKRRRNRNISVRGPVSTVELAGPASLLTVVVLLGLFPNRILDCTTPTIQRILKEYPAFTDPADARQSRGGRSRQTFAEE